MHSDLSLALRIQALDLRIGALTGEINGLPKRIAIVEARLASHKQELADTEEILGQNKKQHRQLEARVEDLKQKTSHLLDQMNSARTNEQFRAFQHEIQFCRDSVDEVEESILAKMEEAERLQHDVSEAEASLKVESAKVAYDVEMARARIESDRQEREDRQTERQVLITEIDPKTLRAYERIRKARGTAVTKVVGENCDSCHVRLRPKFLQDLRQLSDGVLTCESCGLIVYFPDEDEGDVPLEDPAFNTAAQPSA